MAIAPNKKIHFMAGVAIILVLSGCVGGIQQDKVGHFVMGAGVAIGTELIFPEPVYIFGVKVPSGCISAAVLGIGKEYRDSKYGGTVEAADAFATVAGCSITYRF